MPSHLLVETPEQEGRQADTEPTFVNTLEKRMHEAHELARQQLKRSHEHQKRQYDRTARTGEWSVGSPVWLFNPTKQVGKSPQADDLLGGRTICNHGKSEQRSHEDSTK